jgi:hypothetical protein
MSQNVTLLTIDSRDRTHITDSTCDFFVNIVPGIEGAETIELVNSSIPNSQYNINSTNNVILFNDGTTNTAQLPIGAYTASTLATSLASLMSGVGTQTYTVVYNPLTFKLTISAASSFSILATSSISPIIGLGPTTLTGTSLQLPFVVNLFGPSNFYVFIDGMSSNCRGANIYDYGTFVVPNNVNDDGTISSFKSLSNYQMIQCNSGAMISRLHIVIKTYGFVTFNNNGANISLTLKFNKKPYC